MATFKGAVLVCEICEADYRVPQSRAKKARTCSRACAVKLRAKSRMRRVSVNCKQCGVAFEIPRCHQSRRVYCSKACMEASPAIREAKAGRTGKKNPAWQGGLYSRRDGYVYETASGHPFCSKSGHVLQHRLVMERWLRENDPASKWLIELDGQLYLSRSCHVHHKDEDRANNEIANLQPMTPAEHRAHHREIVKKAMAFYRKHHPPT